MPSWMKLVLQDCANASVSGTVPRSNWFSFSNSRPSTVVVPGQGTVVSGVTDPADSRAVAVIVFMLEPGGNCPRSALPGSAAVFDETARISPVPGRTTTMCVGSCWVATAASAAFWIAGSRGVCPGVPGFGAAEGGGWWGGGGGGAGGGARVWGPPGAFGPPWSRVLASVLATAIVKPGV